MTSLVLVHDAWHGAWEWQGVVPILEAARESHGVEEVISPDLPGHGTKSYREIRRITLDYYLDDIYLPVKVKRLDDVVLVGHGFAATYLPRIAVELGEVVRRVVFIAGLLPAEGQTAFDTLPFHAKLIVKALRPTEKGIPISRGVFRRTLGKGLSKDLSSQIFARLVPEPYLPWRVPVSRQGFDSSFPTTYVVLTGDRAIPPQVQRRYARSLASPEIVEVDAGHEAPITNPDQIARCLLKYSSPPPSRQDARAAHEDAAQEGQAEESGVQGGSEPPSDTQ